MAGRGRKSKREKHIQQGDAIKRASGHVACCGVRLSKPLFALSSATVSFPSARSSSAEMTSSSVVCPRLRHSRAARVADAGRGPNN
eukprot:6201546-Pleurochrysis_carterae.AAC.3